MGDLANISKASSTSPGQEMELGPVSGKQADDKDMVRLGKKPVLKVLHTQTCNGLVLITPTA